MTAGFLRDGYAVLDGFLSPAELDPLSGDVDRRLGAPQGPACERPHNTLVPLRWDDPVVYDGPRCDLTLNRVAPHDLAIEWRLAPSSEAGLATGSGPIAG